MTSELLHVPRSITVQGEEIPVPVSLADMAWMAGILDLKGVMIRKNNQTRKTPQYVLYVQTKVRRVAERLSALSGTAPEEHASPAPGAFMRRNCAEHCVTPHVHVNEPYPWNMPLTTRWALTGIAAAVVLTNLAPFMSTYKDYADDVAVITRDFAAGGQGSGAVRKTIARLSALGWQIPAEVTVKLAAALEEKEEDA